MSLCREYLSKGFCCSTKLYTVHTFRHLFSYQNKFCPSTNCMLSDIHKKRQVLHCVFTAVQIANRANITQIDKKVPDTASFVFYTNSRAICKLSHKLRRQIILFNSAVCRKNVDTVVKIVYNVKRTKDADTRRRFYRDFHNKKGITKKSLSLRLRCKHTLCKAKYSVQFLNMFRTTRQPDKLAFTLAKIILCNFCC